MKIACVQANVFFGQPDWNAESAEARLAELHAQGVELAIFPEAYLTGYCVGSVEEARGIAIPVGHPALQRLRQACDRLGMTAVVGFAEDEYGELYNSAALFEPGVEPRLYRKSHLPCLGLDRFVTRGDELPVFETKLGKIGILICFDMRMPESVRVLALKGAEIIALPTNWPEGAEVSASHICIARAAENRVFFAACNRLGKENGFGFIGGSKIIDPVGNVLASAEGDETSIIAEIDPAAARNKRTINVPGEYELGLFAERRPELYGAIVDPALVGDVLEPKTPVS